MILWPTHRRFLVPLVLALLLGGLVLPAPAVQAANTLHVTDCGDAGANTLRGQIDAAQAGDTIVFDQDCAGANAIVLATGTLMLARKVTIDGSGHTVVVDGGCTLSDGVCTSGGATVMMVFPVVVNLTALTIQHGNAGNGGGIASGGTMTVTNCILTGNVGGGGIYSAPGSTLTVTNSTFSGNSAGASGGGGIRNSGTATVTNSTFTGNSATGSGGGIENIRGTATVTNSTFTGNSATGTGGGIENTNGGTLTVTNSTFSGNSAVSFGGGIENSSGGTATVTNSTITGNSTGNSYGGGIFNGSLLTVTNSTISGNSSDGYGGGIGMLVGTVRMTNTIVAGNTAMLFPDVNGYITSNGHNLFGNTLNFSGYLTGFVASDLQNVNPQLGTLGNTGGPTQTIPLRQGSPAIDAGDDAVCAGAAVGGKDQRGMARPVGAHCDIGAFEGAITPLPNVKPTGGAGGSPSVPPAVRPAGSSGGAPNPLPAPRP